VKGQGNAKNGNKYLSWAFSEAAHFAVQFQPAAKKYLARKTKKTNALIAIRALAHKLSRAVYYMLRDQVPYDEQKLFG
jgi:transposase